MSILAQYTKTASCSDKAFDQEVNRYLSYTAPVISVKDAFDKKSDFIFLDAREYEEYVVSHIPKARYIGYDKFKMDALADVPKNKHIVVYCSIGYRSEKIATKLNKAGFTQVYNLYGSLFEWANQGYDLTDNTGKTTSKIHTYNKKWSKWVHHPDLNKVW